MKFLLDANLSPQTAAFLRRRFSFNVKSLIAESLGVLEDTEVVKLAQKDKRIIITLDLDFGKLYHNIAKPSSFGMIIIRTHDQRSKNINNLLENFFSSFKGKKIFRKNPRALTVIEDSQIRTLA
jgi:predicted nuclease of predicted toxin-antitoxin system